ncbi:MAG: HAD family hydrolase [Armatimonadetes bacterium]|nr:HAD family hydrolase [Armatimonadota bacterium]
MSAPLVIFDVDGVLVDTLPANVEAYLHACRQMGLPAPDAENVRRLLGRSAEEMAVALGCPPEHVGEFVDGHARPRYQAIVARGVPTFPGVPEVLAALRDGGTRVAAWTIGGVAQQEAVLTAAGIRRWIELLHAPGVTGYPKPDPRGLEEIVVRFTAAEPRYLVDDRGEMLAPADRIGARRIFAAYGYGTAPTPDPDAVLRAPRDLLALIASAGG